MDNFQQKLQFARRCVHKRLYNTVAKNTQDFRRKFIIPLNAPPQFQISEFECAAKWPTAQRRGTTFCPLAETNQPSNSPVDKTRRRKTAIYPILPRMFGKRRQRKRMARPRADDRNRISARTARSSQAPYQRYIAPRQPRSADGKQNAAKYRLSAALCRLYARPATRQIGANRKRYSARTPAFRNFRWSHLRRRRFYCANPELRCSPHLRFYRSAKSICVWPPRFVVLRNLFLSASECTSAETGCWAVPPLWRQNRISARRFQCPGKSFPTIFTDLRASARRLPRISADRRKIYRACRTAKVISASSSTRYLFTCRLSRKINRLRPKTYRTRA